MAAGGATVEPAVCPFLGLVGDPRTRFAFADASHRCHAGVKPAPIELGHQGALCLSAAYPECGRFRAAQAAGRADALTPGPAASVTVAPPRTVVVAAPPRTAASVTTTLRRAELPSPRRPIATGAVRLLGIAAVLAVLGLAGGDIVGGWLSNDGRTGGPSPSSPAGVTAAPGGTPTGATAQPTPQPTPQPTASLAGTPTPAPTSRIHVVVRGDTLISLAARYGVTVDAIQAANQIADPGLIQVGERLVIPPPP